MGDLLNKRASQPLPRLDRLERNLIINGNMDFWQRGTSFSAINNNVLATADRWRCQNTNTTSVTVTQSTDVPTNAQSGWQSAYSLLHTNVSAAAASTAVAILHSLEGQDYQAIHGRKARVQFWCKSSLAGLYHLALRNDGGTRSYVTTYTITSANTWQNVSIDIPLDTTGTWQFDTSTGLLIVFNLHQTIAGLQTATLNAWQTGNYYSSNAQVNWAANPGATFQIDQVMLVPQDFTQAGSVDIPFQRSGRTIGEELAMCQRYYEKSYEIAVDPGSVAVEGRVVVTATAQTSSIMSLGSTAPFQTRKRAPPSISLHSGSGVAGQWQFFTPGSASATLFPVAINLASSNGFEIANTGTPGFPTTTTFLALGHYAADAEL